MTNSRFKCEECGSTNGYVRNTTGHFMCRRCGHETAVMKGKGRGEERLGILGQHTRERVLDYLDAQTQIMVDPKTEEEREQMVGSMRALKAACGRNGPFLVECLKLKKEGVITYVDDRDVMWDVKKLREIRPLAAESPDKGIKAALEVMKATSQRLSDEDPVKTGIPDANTTEDGMPGDF